MVPAPTLSDALVPAFPGTPGGVELLVILLIMIVVFGIPFVLLLGAVFLGWNVLGSRRERVEELEGRVAELEDELERKRDREPDRTDRSGEDRE